MKTVTEQDDHIFQVSDFNDLVAKGDSVSKTSCVDARELLLLHYVQIINM